MTGVGELVEHGDDRPPGRRQRLARLVALVGLGVLLVAAGAHALLRPAAHPSSNADRERAAVAPSPVRALPPLVQDPALRAVLTAGADPTARQAADIAHDQPPLLVRGHCLGAGTLLVSLAGRPWMRLVCIPSQLTKGARMLTLDRLAAMAVPTMQPVTLAVTAPGAATDLTWRVTVTAVPDDTSG